MSAAENIPFRGFDRLPFAIGGTWLRPSVMREEAERRIAQYRVRTRSPDTPLAALSDGNVQRAVLARELDGGAEMMIAANPCFETRRGDGLVAGAPEPLPTTFFLRSFCARRR
jgi:general nucleoside transport system ATP-binding protein